jgi:hypothetical protein
MDSKRTLVLTCGVLGIVLFIVFACAIIILAGGLVAYFGSPAATGKVLPAPTDTPEPLATFTPTHTLTPIPATDTPFPTVTPTTTPTVTPVMIDPSPTATASPIPAPTDTPVPTDTPAPTDTPLPAPSATPAVPPPDTPVPAPQEEPFMPIGTKVDLSPQANGATGSAVLFSPRQFTMINFNYDGKCPVTDIRLAMEGFPKPPASVLLYLEERPYRNESFAVPVPTDLPAGSANALFVYCDSRDEMLAWGPLIPPQH